ncbi:MAG: hypothetical protein RBR54_10380 [Sulfurimonas sp.]|nr:hypothetical protein [Sulfurimonas sp.]
MRIVLLVFMLVFMSGCVDTDSSSRTTENPDDTNQSVDDSNTTDPTDPTDPIDPGEDLGDPNADQANSDFDTRSAEKDQNACIVNATFKNGMQDSSFDPEETADTEHGMAISSFLQWDGDTDKTMVTVYYPDLIATPVGNQIIITQEYYRVGFDQSWPANTNKTIYVQIPRGIESNYYGCMRYTLSLNAASIVGQRVYRVRE